MQMVGPTILGTSCNSEPVMEDETQVADARLENHDADPNEDQLGDAGGGDWDG
jgi:hypothetical protein